MSRDPHGGLLRRLTRAAGPEAQVVAASATPWQSATFTGMRHRITLCLPHAQAEWLGTLSDDAIEVPGHLLVSLTQTACTPSPTAPLRLVEFDATTVERR